MASKDSNPSPKERKITVRNDSQYVFYLKPVYHPASYKKIMRVYLKFLPQQGLQTFQKVYRKGLKNPYAPYFYLPCR